MTKDKISVMNQSKHLFIFFIVLISCRNSRNQNHSSDFNGSLSSGVEAMSITDTVLMPFADSTLKLRISSISSIDKKEDVYNTSIILLSNNRTVYSDSVYTMSFDMELKDFDNDGYQDLLIFHSSGGRANPTFYLYLVKSKGRILTKVDGFELLPNPELDGNIVTSTALAGSSYVYKFYHISNSKLLMLDSFVTSAGDSVIYEKRIRLLRSEKIM